MAQIRPWPGSRWKAVQLGCWWALRRVVAGWSGADAAAKRRGARVRTASKRCVVDGVGLGPTSGGCLVEVAAAAAGRGRGGVSEIPAVAACPDDSALLKGS